MSIELYLVFVVATVLLVATPGPNVALIVGTSLTFGLRAGLTTVGGIAFGLALQLTVVAAGLSWIVEILSRHFDLIRYVGAAYLALLGLQLLLKRKVAAIEAPKMRSEHAFGRGLAVAFVNPKTFIFLAAFLPQFIPPGTETGAGLILLAATYLVIAVLGDGLWALFAARFRSALSGRGQWIADKISGGILLGGAAVLLAASRR